MLRLLRYRQRHQSPGSTWHKGLKTLALVTLFSSGYVSAASLDELPQLIKQNGKSVVNIQIESNSINKVSQQLPGYSGREEMPEFFQRFFEQMPERPSQAPRTQSAIGSGFIVSEDGFIVTNAHVVENAKIVTVTLEDKREYKAEVIGADERSDIALLKISANDLPAVKLGTSDSLEVGEWVFAIGNPFGFDQTATQGIVSALSRRLPDGTYVPFIQTDVAVNPGNSGGPLFDLDGNVVGVNSQIYSRSGGYMGVSFAIPVDLVKDITSQLQNKGFVSRGRLGVTIQDMSQDLARSFNLDRPTGALIADVAADSPAEKAGIQRGDIIMSFNNESLADASDLPLLVGSAGIGKNASLKVLRDGKEKTLTVKIGELDDEPKEPLKLSARDSGPLGIGVTDLTIDQRKPLGVIGNGVLVKKVMPGSPAADAGIRENDVVISFNNKPVENTKQLASAVKNSPEGKPSAVLVIRNKEPRYLAVTKPESTS